MADRSANPDHSISIEANPSRVVVKVGGEIVADTRDALTRLRGFAGFRDTRFL
jgi:uncharacterized protein (DUF427 family)